MPVDYTIKHGTIYITGTRVPNTIKQVASHGFIWKLWNTSGVFLTFFLIAAMTAVTVLLAVATIFSDPANVTAYVSRMIMLPSTNMIPIEPFPLLLISFFLGITVHEAGHAIATLSEGYDIEEYGLILPLGIPMGAYVKPTEEINGVSYFGYCRILSAGILNNMVVAIGAYLFFQLPYTPTLDSIYFYYFGSLLGNAVPETLSAVGLLPAFVFWLFVVNVNLAILNAVPLFILDGGQIAQRTTFFATQFLPFGQHNARFYILAFINAFIGLAVVLVVVGPYMF